MPSITGQLGVKLSQLFLDMEAAGKAIVIEDLELLLNLHKYVGLSGGSAPVEVLLDQPVYVGGIKIYMPSIGAATWLKDRLVNRMWFDEAPLLSTLTRAYAYAFGRQVEILAAVNDEDQFARLLETWSLGFNCTIDELLLALDAADNGFPIIESKPNENAKLLEFAAAHVEKYGKDLEYWLWAVPAQQVMWVGVESLPEEGKNVITGRDHAFRRLQKVINQLRIKYDLVKN